VICAEDLTFAEQMSVFQDAEVVIGVTGAALSNIVFCNPGATIICLISAKVELGIFSNIAHLLDLNLVYLAGDGDVSFGHVHKPFKVDTNLLSEVLKVSLEAQGV
jgi:capsular polysaccharide biosynthesis protein